MFKITSKIPLQNGVSRTAQAVVNGATLITQPVSSSDLQIDAAKLRKDKNGFIDTIGLAENVAVHIKQGHNKITINFGTKPFTLGKYPVTNAGFLSSVNAGVLTGGRVFQEKVQERSGKLIKVTEETMGAGWISRGQTLVVITVKNQF